MRYLTVDWDENITKRPLLSNDRLAVDLLGPNPDGKHSLLLERGTLAPTVGRQRYYLITIRDLEEIPPLPENTMAVVAVNVTPVGAVFDRDIFLTLGFDKLPDNAVGANIAYYDNVNGVWIIMDSEPGDPDGRTAGRCAGDGEIVCLGESGEFFSARQTDGECENRGETQRRISADCPENQKCRDEAAAEESHVKLVPAR